MTLLAAQFGLQQFLLVSAWMFAMGLMIVMTKRNIITVLMGIELMLNAANLNFVAFAHYRTPGMTDLDGHMYAMFVIILAAAEAAVGLAIAVNFVNRFKTVNIDQADTLRG